MQYHDREWGTPRYDDAGLFEFFLLEGAQAGLSWLTILKRREGYRKAFDNFEPSIISLYDDRKIQSLMEDTGIIRNRLKINAFINNSRVYMERFSCPGSFSEYLWSFTDGKPVSNCFTSVSQLPAATPLSEKMSRELKKLGFSFVGPVTVYAFLQSVGILNDHIVSCFRYGELTDSQK